MRLIEEYLSIQGEGNHAGMLTQFVRASGCAMRCFWCDSKYTWQKGRADYHKPVEEIVRSIDESRAVAVCLTGGEPLLQAAECMELVDQLVNFGYYVSIETGGDQPVLPFTELGIPKLSVCVDYKMPGSGMADRMLLENFASGVLSPYDCVKIVVANEADYLHAIKVLDQFPHLIDETVVYLHPLGAYKDGKVDMSENFRWLAERVIADCLPVKVGLQLHKIAWGNERKR